MNLKAAVQLTLVISLLSGTTAGANPLAGKGPKAGATATATTVMITPELQQADERVKQAEGQLDLARKQLSAARSILKAAEADLKAARAEREALALRTQAQGLAEEAGMSAANNRSLAQATAVRAATASATRPVVTSAAAPANANPNTPAVRTEQMDFSSQPATEVTGDSVTPELR